MDGTDFKVMRIRARLTQWQLSQESGIHPSRISEMERGMRPIEPSAVSALERVLQKENQ